MGHVLWFQSMSVVKIALEKVRGGGWGGRIPQKLVAFCRSKWKGTYKSLHIYIYIKTNIAIGNPPFWWYPPAKMVMFHGYVRLPQSTHRIYPEMLQMHKQLTPGFFVHISNILSICLYKYMYGEIYYTNKGLFEAPTPPSLVGNM